MQHTETRFGYLVALDRGDELIESMTALARREGIAAAVLGGLGAVDSVELGFYRLDTQQYVRRRFDEELEVCSLTGTISLAGGEPFVHAHGVFGRPDFTVVGGHVFAAVCSVTIEIGIHVSPEAVRRGPVDFCNLELLRLEGGK